MEPKKQLETGHHHDEEKSCKCADSIGAFMTIENKDIRIMVEEVTKETLESRTNSIEYPFWNVIA